MESGVKELVEFRFKKAKETLKTAETLLQSGEYDFSLNRSYYAVFHAIRAVNAIDGFDSSKHSGVISFFNQNHVKNGDFPKEISKIIKVASEFREQADYEDFFAAGKEDAEESLKNAAFFVKSIGEYLSVYLNAD